MSVDFRRADGDEDLTFVISTWLDSYRGSYSAGLIVMEDWGAVMGPQLRKVLSRPGVAVWVAYWPGETDREIDLKGWIAVESDVREPVQVYEHGQRVERLEPAGCPLVHYVYVKLPWRKQGIARGLLKAAGVNPDERFLYTCRTPVVSKIYLPLARWNQLIARHRKTTKPEPERNA